MPSPQTAIRWLPVINVGAVPVPAHGLLAVVGRQTVGDVTCFQVQAPTADSQQALLVCGRSSIAPGRRGQAHNAFPASVLYDATSGTPAVGDAWGSKSGSFLLAAGQTGFSIESDGSDDDGGLVVVQSQAPYGFTRQTFSNANYTVAGQSDTIVAQTGSLSAARTVTLPHAGKRAGQLVFVVDESLSATDTNRINVVAGGGDSIVNAAHISGAVAIGPSTAPGSLCFESDGNHTWTLFLFSGVIDDDSYDYQTFSNTDYTITLTKPITIVTQTGTLSAIRTVTLPAQSNSHTIIIQDASGTLTSSHYLKIVPATLNNIWGGNVSTSEHRLNSASFPYVILTGMTVTGPLPGWQVIGGLSVFGSSTIVNVTSGLGFDSSGDPTTQALTVTDGTPPMVSTRNAAHNQAGIMSKGTQTISGAKTFDGFALTVTDDGSLAGFSSFVQIHAYPSGGGPNTILGYSQITPGPTTTFDIDVGFNCWFSYVNPLTTTNTTGFRFGGVTYIVDTNTSMAFPSGATTFVIPATAGDNAYAVGSARGLSGILGAGAEARGGIIIGLGTGSSAFTTAGQGLVGSGTTVKMTNSSFAAVNLSLWRNCR